MNVVTDVASQSQYVCAIIGYIDDIMLCCHQLYDCTQHTDRSTHSFEPTQSYCECL